MVEDACGLPVVSAAVCTTYFMLKELGLKPVAPNAGALLSEHRASAIPRGEF